MLPLDRGSATSHARMWRLHIQFWLDRTVERGETENSELLPERLIIRYEDLKAHPRFYITEVSRFVLSFIACVAKGKMGCPCHNIARTNFAPTVTARVGMTKFLVLFTGVSRWLGVPLNATRLDCAMARKNVMVSANRENGPSTEKRKGWLCWNIVDLGFG